MSTTEESSSDEALQPKRIRDRKIKEQKQKKQHNRHKQHECQQKIEKGVELFLKLRFDHTDIHPTKDPAIVYICRVFKHFLLGDRRLYTNVFYQQLTEKFEVSSQCIAKLRTIFNAIPSKQWNYLIKAKNKSDKEKKARNNSRVFSLNENHYRFDYSVKQLQRVRELFKYGAFKFQTPNDIENEKKIEKMKKWKWIGDFVPDNDNNITNYHSITDTIGHTFRIDDIVSVEPSNDIAMRPWIGRIIQLYENENRKKMVTLRWFYFWNQIISEYDDDDIDTLEHNAENMLSNCNQWPVREWDVFESVSTDAQNTAENPVSCLSKIVYVTYYNSQYKQLLDGANVFECNYNFDKKKQKFLKKQSNELSEDQKRLIGYVNNMNNNTNNINNNEMNNDIIDMDLTCDEEEDEDEKEEKVNKKNNMNSNNKMEMDADENEENDENDDDDLDLNDINGNNNVGFTLNGNENECMDTSPTKSMHNKQKESDESNLSQSEIQSDNSLENDTL